MKVGIDLHGVGDKLPHFFSLISQLLVDNGHEVHLMTGEQSSERLFEQIEGCGLKYTHLFSISDFHIERGTEMNYDEFGNPWMTKEVWDKTKYEYAKETGLELVIDDTERYSNYFVDIPFIHVNIKLPEDKEQEFRNKKIEGLQEMTEKKKHIKKI